MCTIRGLAQATGMLLLPQTTPATAYKLRNAPERPRPAGARHPLAAFPVGEPRRPGVPALGPGSPAYFVRLSYDGGGLLTLSATDGHVTTEAQVPVACGDPEPWAYLTRWWRWPILAEFFGDRPVLLSMLPCGTLRLRNASGHPGAAPVPRPDPRDPGPDPAAGYAPPATAVASPEWEADRTELARVLHPLEVAAYPAPRYRTELGLFPDGGVAVMTGASEWSAGSGLRPPFPFAPSGPGLRPLRRWVGRLPASGAPPDVVRIARRIDDLGRAYYRLEDPTGRYTLWVPEGRLLDRAVLGRSAAPHPVGVSVAAKSLRRLARAVRARQPRGRVALAYHPADAGPGVLSARWLGQDPPIEDAWPVIDPETSAPDMGWAVTVTAYHLDRILALFQDGRVRLAPGATRRWLGVIGPVRGLGEATGGVTCVPGPPGPETIARPD